ncbi:hypothetical protein FA15DRAFT_676376 [Coprinopsis marcescibilis]|uniref:Copper transport protein n=1 Tax=Coprinopsis marcescibilis TaxID=230819 RepID=A0A5C3KAA8_COPMA|nr:hypothetical protein FA15DRAFT_676376 [Coprinopsis marcescibilis]
MAAMAMMVPYFHATAGDHLLFKEWVPTSPESIAGTCIGLFFFSVFERSAAAARVVLDEHWKHRALALAARNSRTSDDSAYQTRSLEKQASSPSLQQPNDESITEVPREAMTLLVRHRIPRRTIPPFVASHDIPRGVLHAFQSALGYILMLAIMTFRVEFFFSIVAGLGVGVILFGRVGGAAGHGH